MDFSWHQSAKLGYLVPYETLATNLNFLLIQTVRGGGAGSSDGVSTTHIGDLISGPILDRLHCGFCWHLGSELLRVYLLAILNK